SPLNSRTCQGVRSGEDGSDVQAAPTFQRVGARASSSRRNKRETTMKRTHEMPWIAGVTVGLAVGLGGVALGQLLARKEDQALYQLVQQARQHSHARQRRHQRGLHMLKLASRRAKSVSM